jgi:hypothetical protein
LHQQKDLQMTWYLALQGTAHMTHQPSVYELQDSADVDRLAEELVSSATLDRVVAIPAVLQQTNQSKQNVTVYVRPAAWGVWTFYQLSSEERRQLTQQNPLLTALSHMAQTRG